MACRIPWVKQEVRTRSGLYGIIDAGAPVGVDCFNKGWHSSSFYGLCNDKAVETSSLGFSFDLVKDVFGYSDYDFGVAYASVGKVEAEKKGQISFIKWGESSRYARLFNVAVSEGGIRVACKPFSGGELVLVVSKASEIGRADLCRLVCTDGSWSEETILSLDSDEGLLRNKDHTYCYFGLVAGTMYAISYADILTALQSGSMTVPSKKFTLAYDCEKMFSVNGSFWALCKKYDGMDEITVIGTTDGYFELTSAVSAESAACVGDYIAFQHNDGNEVYGILLNKRSWLKYTLLEGMDADSSCGIAATSKEDRFGFFAATQGWSSLGAIQSYIGSSAKYECLNMTTTFSTLSKPAWIDDPLIIYVVDYDFPLTTNTYFRFVEFTGTDSSLAEAPQGCLSK